MKNFTTTTPVNTEGSNLSYSTELKCGKSLLEKLSSEWKINFSWCQILLSDVQYNIDLDKKKIFIDYNQNLHYWWPQVEEEILSKIK